MAKKRIPYPAKEPLMTGGRLNPAWAQYFQQFNTMAETQTDAAAAAGDPPTQAEFNALVGKFNALIDKLQAAGVME